MSVFSNIEKFAKIRGFSLQETAEKAGFSKNLIYSYQNNKKPSLTTLSKIAGVLHVSVNELLDTNQEKTKATAIDDDRPLSYRGRIIPNKYLNMVKGLMDEDINESERNQ